jgi:Tfp pilus assembly protein PilV
MNKTDKGITLVELIVAVIIVTVVILGIFSIEIFSRYHVFNADRRSRLQNEVSYSLEHMHKYVSQGTGNLSNPPIERLAANNGFRVRVDLNSPSTPSVLTDDSWVSYTLSSNTLTCTITGTGSGTETLATHIYPGVVYTVKPMNPTTQGGFFINVTDSGPVNGSAVEIGLVSRWDPTIPVSLDNPQVEMKTRILSGSASAH